MSASTDSDSLCLADGDVIIDSGAGRGIKPTMHGLVDPRKASSRIIWGDGTSANANTEATAPGHDLPPFLVAPKASGTLVSVGANTEGTSCCYSFFDKHVFRINGLQIFMDKQEQLKARIVDPENVQVKYIDTKPYKCGVYKAPSLDVFLGYLMRMVHGVSHLAKMHATPSSRDQSRLRSATRTLPQPDCNFSDFLISKYKKISTKNYTKKISTENFKEKFLNKRK